jgi:FKBP-type peptidyl-prolyl cis-trans isomerase FkpA
MYVLQKTKFFIFLTFSLLFLFTACEQEDPDAIAAEDRKKIRNYISENGLDDVAIEHSSGLFYVVEEEGTGANPTLTNSLRISYQGYYLDGKVFDASDGALFQLQGTIAGWKVGIPLFKNGGEGKLLVPSAMGYGAYPPYRSGIRRNAVLIFDFKIIDIGL